MIPIQLPNKSTAVGWPKSLHWWPEIECATQGERVRKGGWPKSSLLAGQIRSFSLPSSSHGICTSLFTGQYSNELG
jgi:hypothetical protein